MSTEFTVDYFPADDFQPSENDVVVGRQKMASKHVGNLRLDEIIGSYLEDYKASLDDKNRKSEILAEIYDRIHNENGRFVKLDHKQRKWYEVTKSVARERISQGLRDNLKEYYKSSLAYKKKRRLVKNGLLPGDDPGLQIASPPVAEKSPARKRPKTGENEGANTKDEATESQEKQTQTTEVTKKTETAPIDTTTENAIPASTAAGTTEEEEDKKEKQGDTKPSAPFLPRDGIKLMEEGFEPLQNDIVVGLRKRSAQHLGNKYLVEVVKTFLDEYRSAGSNKNLKSQVLNKVGSVLSSLDPPARFVRLEQKNQRWYEVEAFYSREKISQTFRDIAQDGYRSANTFKNLKRRRGSSSKNPEEEGKTPNAGTKEPDASTQEDSTFAAQNTELKSNSSSHNNNSNNNKRLPPKKAAARKAAAAVNTPETTSTATTASNTIQSSIELPSNIDVSRLSKKEQLALQIEKLKKEMELLEEEDNKLKAAAATDVNDSCQTQREAPSAEEEKNSGDDVNDDKPTPKILASV